MPAHVPAGAMARRPERSRETVGCSHEDVRRGAHGAADQDGLPDRGKRRGQIRMAWPERSRRTLAMHEEPLHHGADSMRLDLARVVRDVVEQRQLRLRHDLGKGLAHQMRDDLPVGERAVDGRAHGTQVRRAERRVDRRAGQLAVRQLDAMARRRHHHAFEELGADLMAEAARPAVDADDDVAFVKAERRSDPRVEDLHDVLHFEIVIPRSERSHLVALSVFRVGGHLLQLRRRHAAVFLDPVEVRGRAVALLDGPAGAARQHRIHLRASEVQPPDAADAGGHAPRQLVGQLFLEWIDILTREARVQRPHATRNVEAHATGRHHAAAIRIERRDAANRKAVSPMRVRHRVRRPLDPRQHRDVGDLFVYLRVHLAHEPFGRVDDPGHAHGSMRIDPPLNVRFAREQSQVH